MKKLYKNISELVTLNSCHKKDGRNLIPEDLSILKNISMVFDKEIIWIGNFNDLPKEYTDLPCSNLTGHTVLPEIVDCHTHLVFGGDRSEEYSMRLNGADYQEIANFGGGILFTEKETNKLSRKELLEQSIRKIETIHSYGVGTIEIKSGYGLNFDKEYELSHIINDLKIHFLNKVQIFNTYMAAHAVPKGLSSSNEYITTVCIPLLEKLSKEKIIDCVDIFHEDGYFNEQDVRALLGVAKSLNIKCKTHADEFQDNNGASLACELDCLSTDHLLKSSKTSIQTLSQSKTVATFLPGTAFFLGKEQVNARKFLDAGVKVAIASDYNPGSSHCDNLLLLASIAAPTYKINSAELWASITHNAAHALGLYNQGHIDIGMDARFSIFNVDCVSKVSYHWGKNFSVTIE